MELELSFESRKIFLKRFTYKIILAYDNHLKEQERIKSEEERRKRIIEVEKLRKRFSHYLREIEKSDKREAEEIKNKVKETTKDLELIPSISSSQLRNQLMPQRILLKQPAIRPGTNAKIFSRRIIPIPRPEVVNKELKQKLRQTTSQLYTKEFQESGFGRLNPFIKDISVTLIECPGKGKNVIITKKGRKMTTQIMLSKEEIDSIIQFFSDRARIPIIEGIIQARIDNLFISAVISNIVSSRFIISKRTPYSLLKGRSV